MTETEHSGDQQRSKLNGKWATRMLLITLVLLLFGGWGFYDAVVAYPNRGKSFAAYQQLQYLQAAQRAGKMFDASVIDPVGQLETLKDQDVLQLSEFDRAQREWLTALSVPGMGTLNAEHDPRLPLEKVLELYRAMVRTRPAVGERTLFCLAYCGGRWRRRGAAPAPRGHRRTAAGAGLASSARRASMASSTHCPVLGDVNW